MLACRLPAPFRRLLGSSKEILRSGAFDVRVTASDRRSRGGAIDQRSTRKGALVSRRPPLVLLTAVCVTSASVLLAACGSSSSTPGVAHIGTTSAASSASGSGGGTPESGESGESRAGAQQKMVRFAQCMRTHGEPEFPEPVEGGIRIQNQNGHGPNPESSQFKAAEKACSKYAPSKVAPSPAQLKAHEEQALKFSECMRHHGVPNFPDPNFSAGSTRVTLKLGKSSGIEPGSPQFQAAQRACQSVLPLGKGSRGVPFSGAPPAAKTGGPVGSAGQSSGQTAVAP